MAEPSLLFIYRVAMIQGRLHARCICCSPDSPETWPASRSWRGYVLPTGPAVSFSQVEHEEVSCGSELPAFPQEVESIYSDNALVLSAPLHARPKLIAMQNFNYVVIEGLRQPPKLPFFLSRSEVSDPSTITARVEMLVRSIDDLPDVKRYNRRNSEFVGSGKADKWDSMLIQSEAASTVEVPTGAYLPGVVEVDGRESDVAYQIKSYTAQSQAILDIHLADSSVTLQPGSIIRRKARDLSNFVITQDIARIVDIEFA